MEREVHFRLPALEDIIRRLAKIDSELESLKKEKPQRLGLLTSIEAAKALQITTRHLQNLRDRGDIGFIQCGRVVRFKPEDLQAYIDSFYVSPNFKPSEQ